VYRRLLFGLLLVASATAVAQRDSGLRADEAVYELRGPAPRTAALTDPASDTAVAGGTPHGDLVRARPTEDVLRVPAAVASTVRPRALLEPTAGTGVIPPSAAPDVAGAFRFICQPGQVSYDDPIVFPGQPGKSHLHQWFGNTAADAHSTYESLRRSGESTCMNVANRSAYWMPAMLDGKGHVVRPDYVTIYYKRLARPEDCARMAARGCAALPRGLRIIFGYDMVAHRATEHAAYFNCDGPGAQSGHYDTITEAAAHCPAGARLGAVIVAPDCWDGQRLDSANHRDHMARPGYGSNGVHRCPSTHPYAVPTFTMGAWYSVDQAGAADWYLSSDEMPGMKRMPAGSTFHADWFGAWDDEVMAMWTDHCIAKLLNCSGGDLGNGMTLKQVGPFDWKTKRRLVAVPPRPKS
jgi:hypothetical protein